MQLLHEATNKIKCATESYSVLVDAYFLLCDSVTFIETGFVPLAFLALEHIPPEVETVTI